MPELPEVETIRRDLEKNLVTLTITHIQVNDPSALTGILPDGGPRRKCSSRQFKKQVLGRKVSRFLRRGKYLILEFTDQTALIFHLRMTGQLILDEKQKTYNARITFCFNNRQTLSFYDQRRFGEVWYASNWKNEPDLNRLGIEPLNGSLTPEFLKDKFKNRTAPVHSVLLNQHLIAGIGNIYAVESLFQAGILPFTPAGRISLPRLERLCTAIKAILSKSVKHRGYSMNTYVDAFGRRGGTQHFTVAYGNEGKPCAECGAIFQKKKISGRGVVYCSQCQK